MQGATIGSKHAPRAYKKARRCNKVLYSSGLAAVIGIKFILWVVKQALEALSIALSPREEQAGTSF